MTFDDSSYDESKNIENIAKTLNLESVIFKFDKSRVNEYVEEALNNMNNLVIDYSFVPTYLLSKEPLITRKQSYQVMGLMKYLVDMSGTGVYFILTLFLPQ